MAGVPIPDNEEERLKSLRDLDILDSPAEERFDRITRVAARSLDVKYSEINFIDESRQWSKSQFGTTEPVCDRKDSFCAETMLDDGVTVISDATEHEQFCAKAPVTNPPHIRFYMSATVNTPDGLPAGTLCVFDDEPAHPGEREEKIIRDLGNIVEGELDYHLLSNEQTRLIGELEEAERRASTDSLTGAWRKDMIIEVLERELDRAERENLDLSVGMLDIDRFKSVNDRYGHQIGDRVLEMVAERIRRAFRTYDALGRYGGEEFLVVFVEAGADQSAEVAERIRHAVDESPVETGKGGVETSVSIGVATRSNSSDSAEELIGKADERLYEAKRNGRNQVVSE